jgi:hypothetical protein
MPAAGEIWVGKEADIGAQIAVSSVRGDKVLWVDKEGLHNGTQRLLIAH